MKVVADNFSKMLSPESNIYDELTPDHVNGFGNGEILPISWCAEDGLSWRACDFNLYITGDPSLFKGHNLNVAISYVRHNAKTFEEYLEIL